MIQKGSSGRAQEKDGKAHVRAGYVFGDQLWARLELHGTSVSE